MNTIFLLSHLGLGDIIFNIPLVNYLSVNNKVELVCPRSNLKNATYFFKNNPNVSLYIVDYTSEISPKHGCPLEKFNNITNGKIVYLSGLHKNHSNINSFPFFIYDDVGVDLKIFKEYSYYENTDKSNYLYNIIKNNEYVFLCNNSSAGELFDINNFLNTNNIDPNKIIVICSNKNYYSEDHKFYEIAQNFVYHINDLYVLDYKETIENAKMVCLTDSSLFCFAVQLKIKSKNNFLYTRNKHFNWDRLSKFFGNQFKIM